MTLPLQQWQHPQHGSITFEDRRMFGRRQQPHPEPLRLEFSMSEVAGHEARHAACAALFDFKAIEASAAMPANNCYGHVVFDHEGEQWTRMRLGEMAVTLLVGGLGEENWPPAWPPNPTGKEHDEGKLAYIVERMQLSEKAWNGLIDIARMITRDPAFKKLEGRYQALLGEGLTLNGRMLEDIHASVREETRPLTKAEREDAELREQHRQWMTGVMEAGTEYAREQAEERAEQEAARDLRRRCDELAAEAAADLR